MTSPKQIFDILPGIYNISRRVLPPRDPLRNNGFECIKAAGFATITVNDSDPNVLFYSEKLIMREIYDSESGLDGMEARQKYKYKFDPEANTLTKYFWDDRLFYKLCFDELAAGNDVIGGHRVCGEHLCIQDNYVANYLFNESGKSYTLKYSVNGPKKCYEIITDYDKLRPGELINTGINVVNGDIQ